MISSIVYLPVELKHRELDARLMTAAHLLEAGVSVVLGQQWAIFQNFPAWPPGLILFKTVNDIQARSMKNFQIMEHVVAATDEEVLTCVKSFCVAFSPRAAEHCDVFYAQSELHKTDVENRFPNMQGKVVVTGNPRIEMTSRLGRQAFQAEADEIRRQTGPFVLLNANYSGINSVWGSTESVYKVILGAGLLNADDPNAVETFKSWMNWEEITRRDMIRFLVWAAENIRDRKIVIRPHPGERVEFWQDLVNDHPNVLVVPKSPHIPWIMASDLVVHTGCTTGLEAALLEKPALNIQSAPDPLGERITSLVNPTFTSAEDAITAANSFLRHNTGPLADMSAFDAVLEQYFPGFHDGGPAKRIAEECIINLSKRDALPASTIEWSAVGGKYRVFERTGPTLEKFSITPEEILGAFEVIARKIGATRKVNISPIDDSLFLFQSMS
jgi:surface carbohydrate biosynthesis protein